MTMVVDMALDGQLLYTGSKKTVLPLGVSQAQIQSSYSKI